MAQGGVAGSFSWDIPMGFLKFHLKILQSPASRGRLLGTGAGERSGFSPPECAYLLAFQHHNTDLNCASSPPVQTHFISLNKSLSSARLGGEGRPPVIQSGKGSSRTPSLRAWGSSVGEPRGAPASNPAVHAPLLSH